MSPQSDYLVTLSLTAFDKSSGVSTMLIAQDPAFSGAAPQDYVPRLSFPLASGDGYRPVY